MNDNLNKSGSGKTWGKWEKAEVLLKPAGGLLTALTVTIIGILSSGYLEDMQSAEMRTCLYTELLSAREESESELRKDMFTEIIGSFLGPDTASMDAKLLRLELLMNNFHESLNLEPIFKHLNRQITKDISIDRETRQYYLKRLRKVGDEVINRQLAALEPSGTKKTLFVNMESLLNPGPGILLDTFTCRLDNIDRQVRIEAIQADTLAQEVKVRLVIVTSMNDTYERVDQAFNVGPFDFPLIDNTRLTRDQRCTISLNSFKYPMAALTFVLFPGSHASLKEKAYIEDIMNKLIAELD